MNEYLFLNTSHQIFQFEYLLPLLAIVVSIFSLLFSVYFNRKTFRLNERHNKKSVEPVLSTNYISLAEPKTTEFRVLGPFTTYSYTESLELKNCGFGPASIKSFMLIIDNKNFKDIFELYDKTIGISKYHDSLSLRRTLDNDVIASNETMLIFKLHFKEQEFFKEFHDLAKKIGLKIEFETIYEEKRIYTLDVITG